MTTYPPEAPLDCSLCPRLRDFLTACAKEEPDWFNSPVPSFGDENAQILIVGLAPGKTGANKTGRPFTGDWAGDLLYATLAEFGLSTGKYEARPDDTLALKNTMVTNAVRCVPPENKPVASEINACRPFLVSRINALKNLKVLVTLGKISHDSTIRTLGQKPSQFPFGHDKTYEVQDAASGRSFHVVSSYHCSRYNTNTGRLTEAMFHDVFRQAVGLL